MKPRFVSIGSVCGVALAAIAAHALSADAPPAPPPGPIQVQRQSSPDVVTLNFVNAEIEGVAKVISEVTGKNFLIDPRVKGTVNIVSAKPMSRDMVYQVFLSAIRLQGFTAIEDRGVVKILPEAEARTHNSPTLGPQDKPRTGGDSIQTQVFQLRHQPASQIVPVLRPLIATNNTIAAYPNNNTLVVTDYASNLQRIAKIIESVDQPYDSDPIIIPLKHASALDVAQTINRLLTESAPASESSQRITVTADARTNSVLARAGDSSRMIRVRQLVAMLDSPTSAGGNIHVIYLKNAVAVKLAEVLRAIYSGESSTAASAAGRPAPSLVGQPATTTPAPAAGPAPGIIQADAATNSIIITAPDAIYNNLRAVVEKLDVRRAQVYVEALIAELTADKAAEFGIQWQSLGGLGRSGTQGFGGTNFGLPNQNILGIAQNPGVIGRGLNVGILNGTVNIPGVGEILNLQFLARALETDNNANILSTPTLLTLDNEEARIVIGQNIPIVTGQYAVTAAATTPTPFQTIERKDVGLTLRIKPQISEGGAIRLQLFQEVSNVTESPTIQGVVTNKRAVESTVLVGDGQIVVIGGLIQDTVKDGEEKVPGLGDLPVIGSLFRYRTRTRSKANLMVFLRPVLLRGGESADSLTRDRYDYILSEQLKSKPAPSGVLPNFEPPTLPQLQAPPVPGTAAPSAPK